MANNGNFHGFYPVEVVNKEGECKGIFNLIFTNFGLSLGCFSCSVANITHNWHANTDLRTWIDKEIAKTTKIREAQSAMYANIAARYSELNKISPELYAQFRYSIHDTPCSQALESIEKTLGNLVYIRKYWMENKPIQYRASDSELNSLADYGGDPPKVLKLKAEAFKVALLPCCKEAANNVAYKISQWVCGDQYSQGGGFTAQVFEELVRQGFGKIASTPSTPNMKYGTANPCGITVYYPPLSSGYLFRDRYCAELPYEEIPSSTAKLGDQIMLPARKSRQVPRERVKV